MTTYAPNSYYSAPEVYHKPESLPMEVLPSRSPEVAYDPRAYPPEIASTNAPEPVYRPQDFPPEPVPGQFPEDKDRTWEIDGASSQNLVVEKAPKKPSFLKRYWILLTICLLLIIGGGVGGGVGGVLASKKSKSEPSLPALENAPTDPEETPSSLALTTGLPAGAPKLLQQTAVAAASCADGDRWVFMQDVNGNIRAAQYSNANSNWTFAPEQHNFTAAKLGTSMSASCVNITEDVGLALGTYLSLVYVSPSDEVQQTVLSGGKWKDSPVVQASKLPSEGSYLSVSTHFLPTPEPGAPSKMSPQSFSSVATFQNNQTLFTIDLDPRLDSNQEKRSNKNLLANFDGTQDVNYETPIGFACNYNLPIPKNTTHYYTRCFMGNSRPLPAEKDSDPNMVQIFDYIWEYPVAEAFNRSDKVYNYTANDNIYTWWGPHVFGTEIALTSVGNNDSAIAFVNFDQKLVVNEMTSYHPEKESGVEDRPDQEYKKVLPYLPFAATSAESSTVYVYYQANATAIGEISSDVNRNLWSDEAPQYLFIT